MNGLDYDIAVIGAGINGLSTTYHLANKTNLKVLLIDQY
jgi:glycine/D-amino acid oxidase-like deaminating enzyme